MTKEEYKSKKLAELSMIQFSTNPLFIEQSKQNIKSFLSQTIDELWKDCILYESIYVASDLEVVHSKEPEYHQHIQRKIIQDIADKMIKDGNMVFTAEYDKNIRASKMKGELVVLKAEAERMRDLNIKTK